MLAPLHVFCSNSLWSAYFVRSAYLVRFYHPRHSKFQLQSEVLTLLLFEIGQLEHLPNSD